MNIHRPDQACPSACRADVAPGVIVASALGAVSVPYGPPRLCFGQTL